MLSTMIGPGVGRPMDPDRIDQLWSENAELKRSLGNLRESYSQLEYECNFNRIKATELHDIAEMRHCGDDIHDKLVVKSLQNAELSMEVEKLGRELNQANACILDLGKERAGSKRLLLELADVVRTLQSVQVDYEMTSWDTSYLSGQDASVRNIKRKVEAIMEERKALISRCNQLEAENEKKNEHISTLEAQFQMLNEMNKANGTPDGSIWTDSVGGPISRSFTDDSQGEPTISKKSSLRKPA